MCRNIKPLFNFDPVATDQEIHEAAHQFVRKVSGFTKPSHKNQDSFNQAVERIALDVRQLLDSLDTAAAPRDRKLEADRARQRSAQRFGAA